MLLASGGAALKLLSNLHSCGFCPVLHPRSHVGHAYCNTATYQQTQGAELNRVVYTKRHRTSPRYCGRPRAGSVEKRAGAAKIILRRRRK
ncbi:unnamed protein product [Urochloa humidicola]